MLRIMKIDKQNGNVCYSDAEHLYWDATTKQKYISVTTLIGKYAEVLAVDNLPDPSPDTSSNVTENKKEDSKTLAGI